MPLHRSHGARREAIDLNPVYARDLQLPRDALPDGPMDPDVAYQFVHDELLLDGRARTNLATFVTTWAERQAARLMDECSTKNMIDKDEYPVTAELEERCVRILGRLWHAGDDLIGCSTAGSSEACMLAGLALKRRWQHRTGGAGRPNLVMGANVQVCWEKFCAYWEVEPRTVPMEGDRYHLDGPSAAARVDENTIGVVAILGSTFDGSYEPVAEIAAALDDLGVETPIHVDGASGAMVAPFLDPGLEWDFRLERVASINASGHKYGLVPPGIGWAVWRDKEALPEDLVFNVDYLGGQMPTFTLNFSRPGSQIAAQYYTLIRLGREGFTAVHARSREIAQHLSRSIGELGPFECLTDGGELPAFAFKLRDDVDGYTVYDVSSRLRAHGWIVPAYQFPPDRQDLHVLRVVVRNGFSTDLADHLLDDLEQVVEDLEREGGRADPERAGGFHH
jgi:glutamate decarboxylase